MSANEVVIDHEDPMDTRSSWVGSLLTTSHVAYNVIDPCHEDVRAEDVARSLSHICRYNGHVPSFYSVAEHCLRVARWLRLATRPVGITSQIMVPDSGPSLQLTGLLHDAAEAYVGDMIRPLKKHPEMGGYHQIIEERNAAAIHQALGGLWPYPDLVHQADMAVYEWEVANIRTGKVKGLPPDAAMDQWLQCYRRLAANAGRSY